MVDIAGSGDAITRLAMSPSNALLALGRTSGEVALWTFAEDRRRWLPFDITSPHSDRVTWIDFDAEGSRVVSTSADGQVIVWDALTGAPVIGPLRIEGAGAVTYYKGGSSTTVINIDAHGAT